MSSHKSRLQKLEKRTQDGPAQVKKYLCIIHPDHEAEGYKIQPFITEKGGTGGEPFYLATEADLQAFDARADVELLTIRIMYASEALQVTE